MTTACVWHSWWCPVPGHHTIGIRLSKPGTGQSLFPGTALVWPQVAAPRGLAVLHRGTPGALSCCELQPDTAGRHATPWHLEAALVGQEAGAWPGVDAGGRPDALRTAIGSAPPGPAQAHPAIPVKPAGLRPHTEIDQSAPSSPD